MLANSFLKLSPVFEDRVVFEDYDNSVVILEAEFLGKPYKFNMTLLQAGVFMTINENNGISATSLNQLLGVTLKELSPILNSLIRSGLVVREGTNKNDPSMGFNIKLNYSSANDKKCLITELEALKSGLTQKPQVVEKVIQVDQPQSIQKDNTPLSERLNVVKGQILSKIVLFAGKNFGFGLIKKLSKIHNFDVTDDELNIILSRLVTSKLLIKLDNLTYCYKKEEDMSSNESDEDNNEDNDEDNDEDNLSGLTEENFEAEEPEEDSESEKPEENSEAEEPEEDSEAEEPEEDSEAEEPEEDSEAEEPEENSEAEEPEEDHYLLPIILESAKELPVENAVDNSSGSNSTPPKKASKLIIKTKLVQYFKQGHSSNISKIEDFLDTNGVDAYHSDVKFVLDELISNDIIQMSGKNYLYNNDDESEEEDEHSEQEEYLEQPVKELEKIKKVSYQLPLIGKKPQLKPTHPQTKKPEIIQPKRAIVKSYREADIVDLKYKPLAQIVKQPVKQPVGKT
jgi:hypothetical protein